MGWGRVQVGVRVRVRVSVRRVRDRDRGRIKLGFELGLSRWLDLGLGLAHYLTTSLLTMLPLYWCTPNYLLLDYRSHPALEGNALRNYVTTLLRYPEYITTLLLYYLNY